MKQPQVLLVGEWPEAAQPLDHLLPSQRVSVTKCAGGIESLKRLQEGGFDILLTQKNLSDLSPYQLCSFLKSSNKTAALPLIIFDPTKVAHSASETNDVHPAGMPDAIITAGELTNNPEKLLHMVQEQTKIGQELGWKSEPVQLLTTDNITESESTKTNACSFLFDQLTTERLVSNFSVDLISNLHPHDKLLQSYFGSIQKLVNADLFGLVIASTLEPWAAFAGKPGLRGKDLDGLLQRIKNKLSLTDKLTVEVAIETAGESVQSLGQQEVVEVINDRLGLGLIIFANYGEKKFSATDLTIINHLRRHLASVMLLLLHKRQIEILRTREAYQAATDPLTGLYNLDFFVGFLQQQLLFSFRQSLGVSVVIMDIDNFADINARLGLEIGNVMLTKLAGRLLGVARASDLLARYGGDEFALVLPNTDVQGARVLAEKIRLEIEQMTFIESGDGQNQHMTLSIGCAQFDMNDLNPETILRDAKHALQKAKERGKNCVVV